MSPDVDTKNPMAMADFYGVSVEDYLAGQEWAREHLADLRREAGLDPDTGWPLQPADAPVPPAPRPHRQRRAGTGLKASMVSHRVRR